MIKPKGLGRGLDALLGDDPASTTGQARELDVELLCPGRYQPRTRMDPDSLDELAASIKSQGIIQPVIVRPLSNGSYEIIAGERRWRAAQLAGLTAVPVVVREIPDEAALAMSLIENIQREELNPLEEAAGIHRLIDEFGLTHQQAADAVGRSRSATTNLLRLLQLPEAIQAHVLEGDMDMGHARALLPLDTVNQLEVAATVVRRKLSVRQTEVWVKRLQEPQEKSPPTTDADIERLEVELADQLGTRVQLRHKSSGQGQVILHYTSLDHLESLLRKFGR